MSAEFKKQQEHHRRIRFIKRLLRPLPRRATLHRYPIIKWFAQAARRRPYLWSFRVRAMTPAFFAGSVLALLPIIGIQIPLAALAALALRANLPTIVGLQLLTNVLTAAPIYGVTYLVGDFVCDLTGLVGPQIAGGPTATRLFVGGIVCAILMAAVLDIVYRFLAYEAQKHHWHLPRRKRHEETPPPTDPEA